MTGVYMALEKAKQGPNAKRAIVVISVGVDNNSRYDYSELRRMAEESGVLIYAIGITDPSADVHSHASAGRVVLDKIAGITGGRAFFPNSYEDSKFIEVCTTIARELRHQYSIGFYPTDPMKEAALHKIHIKVRGS